MRSVEVLKIIGSEEMRMLRNENRKERRTVPNSRSGLDKAKWKLPSPCE
jgi:hypothetical protein